MLVQEPVHAAVWHCLNHYAYGDATFLAERLFAEVHSDESLHLLATCYYRSGKLGQAYDILSKNDVKTPQNKFLMARCCADLNKTNEAEMLLTGEVLDPKPKEHLDDLVQNFGDAACFALQILAKIYSSTERMGKAVDSDRKALKLNPLLWKSFEALCQRGDTPDPNKVFSAEKLDNLTQCQGMNPILNYVNKAHPGTAAAAATTAPSSNANPGGGVQSSRLTTPAISHGASSTSTPILPVSSLHLVQQQQQPPPPPHHHPHQHQQDHHQQKQALQQQFLMVTPVNQVGQGTPLDTSIGSDSCFVGSPMSTCNELGKFSMSGVGELNFTSDVDMTNVSENNKPPQAKMPPPLLRPKVRRVMGHAQQQQQQQQQQGSGGGGGGGQAHSDTYNNMTPPVMSMAGNGGGGSSGTGNRFTSFGRLPRGALVFSSSGKAEPLASQNLINASGLAAKLDFSPLAVLSPCSLNMSSASMMTTPIGGGSCGVTVQDGTPTSNAPLINTTNNEPVHNKLKTRLSQNENVGSSPLKTCHTSQNQQNTPANSNSNSSGPGGGGVGGVGVVSNVRRSSRLFGSSQNNQQSNNTIKAAKENTKTPTSATPSKSTRSTKSPSKKSSKGSSRLSSKNNQNNDGIKEDAASKEAQLQAQNEKNKLCGNDSDVENLVGVPRINVNVADQQQHNTYGGYGVNNAMFSPEAQAMVNNQALSLQKQSMEGLMMLMRQVGSAYLEMSRFNSRKAVNILDSLVPHQKQTGWILGLLGMAHFEMGEYKEAQKLFRDTRDLDPHRTDFMEYFSTALWHLQEEVELSALSQDLTRVDKMAPQTWCAAGNCFSLQKEHENAIKFFQRAAQVQPSFAYAYTLLGHEYITIEELDKALSCFQTAVRMDPRHYNAWYGIGLVYYKQERFKMAEIFYRKALNINPNSPVLMCHVAVVQHALQKTDKALETLNIALKQAPKNPLCKFERASILFASDRHDEALKELNELKVLVPKESPVYFLMGKVHNKLNDTHKALMHFSWAMDLDPKGANSQIKDALDRSMNRVAQEDMTRTPGGAGGSVMDTSNPPGDDTPQANVSIRDEDDEMEEAPANVTGPFDPADPEAANAQES